MNLFNLLHHQIISIATSATDENGMTALHEAGPCVLNLCNFQNNQKSFVEFEIEIVFFIKKLFLPYILMLRLSNIKLYEKHYKLGSYRPLLE